MHRLARAFAEQFVGHRLEASSPQGRFAEGAATLDGLELESAAAWGKQMFLGFAGGFAGPVWLRVHLGLYGMWRFAGPGLEGIGRRRGKPEPVDADAIPAPRGAVRLRLVSERHAADLSGPTACELLDASGKAAAERKLGPDPLRRDADPERAWSSIDKSKTAIGQLLMRQDVVAGIGNIYRAELLFCARIDPHRPGRDLAACQWQAMWQDLVRLMSDGVKSGRIDTIRPVDRRKAGVTGRAAGGRGSRCYVAHREGQPCRVCGTTVLAEDMAGRRLYWCPICQTG